MMSVRVLTMVVLTTSVNALFLRNSQQEQQQRNLNNNGLDTLSNFDLDPSAYNQPICQDYKMCLPLSSVDVVSGECKGPQDCTGVGGECRYNTNTRTTLCDITDGSLCAYDCVEDDSYQVIPTFRDSNQKPIVVCEDYKMCLPLSTLEEVVEVGCTRTEDCELGECRYNSNTKTTLCDTADGSLCGYNCVDPD